MFQSTSERLRAAIDKRLSQPLPSPVSADDDFVGLIRLNVRDQVRTYDRNPRQAVNEKYLEIKESIRQRGLDNMVTVTRRPGQDFYMPAKGGNTRIQILHELIDEGCAQFTHMDFREIPWPGEVKMLAAHIVENEQRADLCFWDKAHSIFTIKAEIEKELGEELSQRKFSEYLKEHEGIQVSQGLLSFYSFAVRNLVSLGEVGKLISLKMVQGILIPGRSATGSITHKLQGAAGAATVDAAWSAAVDVARIAAERSNTFDAHGLIDAFTEQAAVRLGVTVDEIVRMQQVLAADADLEGDALREAIELANARWAPPAANPAAQQAGSHGGSGVEDPNAGPDFESGGADGLADDDDGEEGGQRSGMPPTSPALRPAAGQQSSRPAELAGRSGGARGDGVRMAPAVAPTPVPSSGAAGAAPDLSLSLDPSEDDPAELLRTTVLDFLHACGIDINCYVETDLLPLGFMLDFPADLSADGPNLIDQGMAGDRPERYWGWWFIVNLTRQNHPEGLAVLPPTTRYGQAIASDDAWQDAVDNMVGDPAFDSYGDALQRILNPDRRFGGEVYLNVVLAVRAWKLAYPQRFTLDFWRQAGVPEDMLQKLHAGESL